MNAAAASASGAAPLAGKAADKSGKTDVHFEQLVDDFVFGTLALSPTMATGVGYHVHGGAPLDDLLDDFSPAGIAASRAFSA